MKKSAGQRQGFLKRLYEPHDRAMRLVRDAMADSIDEMPFPPDECLSMVEHIHGGVRHYNAEILHITREGGDIDQIRAATKKLLARIAALSIRFLMRL